jgi:hypothetical protein
MPATLHCQLERLPGFDFLECCCGEPSPAARDCQTAPCDQIEVGFFKSESRTAFGRLPTPTPVAIVAVPAQSLAGVRVPPVAASPGPPELTPSWQFLLRAAQPPRAPTFVS